MIKILLLVGIAVMHAAEEKNIRMITLDGSTADVAEHVFNYFTAQEKESIRVITPIEEAPEEKSGWGISSMFGKSKTVKIPVKEVEKPKILTCFKLHGFDPASETKMVYKIDERSDFLGHAQMLRANNFKVYGINDWDAKTQSGKYITHLFLGALAKERAVPYYFAQKIAKIMGFPKVHYLLLDKVENDNKIATDLHNGNLYSRMRVKNKHVLHYLYQYIRAQKKPFINEKLTSMDNKVLSELRLIQVQRPDEKVCFIPLENHTSFTIKHLEDVLQGKFFLYSSDKAAENIYSSSLVSKGKYNHDANAYTLFIGEGVNELTPHDYFIEQLKAL